MSKTVTLRLDDPVYRLFRDVAERENRPISNFIETAVMRFVREHETVDEFEMAEIRGNAALNQSLRRGRQDAKRRRGTFTVAMNTAGEQLTNLRSRQTPLGPDVSAKPA